MGILKEEYRKTSFSFESRIRLIRDLVIGSGFGTEPDQYNIGLELYKNDVGFMYYYRQNQDLGGTIELGISIILK